MKLKTFLLLLLSIQLCTACNFLLCNSHKGFESYLKPPYHKEYNMDLLKTEGYFYGEDDDNSYIIFLNNDGTCFAIKKMKFETLSEKKYFIEGIIETILNTKYWKEKHWGHYNVVNDTITIQYRRYIHYWYEWQTVTLKGNISDECNFHINTMEACSTCLLSNRANSAPEEINIDLTFVEKDMAPLKNNLLKRTWYRNNVWFNTQYD